MSDETKTQAGASNRIDRPATPCQAWLRGETDRRENGRSREACPYDYPGARWEWQAGWDYAEQEIADVA